ncbi:OmpA family protein [Gillisia sp. Q332]|uniref:OmpA family protein n=1 Tax=Gillisia xinjiangensis TaxID=3384765 RepID=UPI00391DE858
MKIFLKYSLLLVILFNISNAFAQKAKLKKAEMQYENLAYINSQKIYLQVVKNGYTSAEIFKKLGNTYYFNADYKNAAEWYNRLITEFQSEAEPEYYFRAAQSLKSEGKYQESDVLMEQFARLGGKELVISNFQQNQNYLSEIRSKPKKYILEKTEVSTSYPDFGPSFYQDKLVYASAKPDSTTKIKIHEWNKQPFFNLYQATINPEGTLENSQKLSGEINTRFHESSTTFTKDGTTVYFTRNNFMDGRKGKDEDRNIRLKIYKATKVNDQWKNIIELPMNDADYSVAHPALSVNEKRLYFSSDMPGTKGQADLWYVEILGDDQYGTPVNLGTGINTEVRESFPFISSDNTLYFASNGRAGLGGLDIFFTKLDANGMPTEISVMGEPVNSKEDDFGFIIDKERDLAFLSSNRSNGIDNIYDDIYRAIPSCEIILSGLVSDVDTKEILPGTQVLLFDENNEEVQTFRSDKNALYTFDVDCNKNYSVRAIKDGYTSLERLITTPEDSANIDFPLELKREGCSPNDLGCLLTLQPIYFDFDQSNIRPDAEIELAKIYAALKEYPELNINIESHTDSRGGDDYNLSLSQRRAQSTMQWLLDKGIQASRLSAEGYGETQLVNSCSNSVYCSNEEHELNRRSMFIVTN